MSKSAAYRLFMAGLGLGVALSGTGMAAAEPAAGSPASVSVQAAQDPGAYDRFNRYLSRSPSTESLSSARAVLINHAKSFTKSQATLAVLKLENAQNAYLDVMLRRIDRPAVQKSIAAVYKPGMTLNEVLSRVSAREAVIALQDMRAIDYKLETGEGLFYPVIHYKSYKRFKPYVKSDIASYLDLMARESEDPANGDAALLIGWDDALQRAVDFESFLATYSVSNRREAIRERFRWAKLSVFYGQSNTPLFDYDTGAVDPEARAAYTRLLSAKSESELASSKVLTDLQGLMDLLDRTGGKRTRAVEDYLSQKVPVGS
ncbi:hypothetical protein [Saccharibacillus qingshengii]|uniref:hypothetical protein n=1 Tax=Saccharibacillus qingshengii TaxID=1763540 RepID=UPI0015545ACF|nr:hypothetical protein [Saccharibacillus qingshengii]